MNVTMEVKGLDKLEKALNALPDEMSAGVKVTGKAVAYALVWEFGSARIKKPGPKTILSTNPLGMPAILTLQAPNGYIRINKPRYIEILKEEFAKVKLGSDVSKWTGKYKKFLNECAEQCADVIAETAPIDTGQLAGHIKAAKVGDPALAGTPNAYGATELDLGSNW